MSQTDQQTEYDEYLTRRHADKVTASEMIDSFVQKATGDKVEAQKRLMLGEANEVYDVTTTSGEAVIVRVSHEEYEAFGKEKWAIEQCQKVGVPVPKVLLVEDVRTDGKFRSICILEKLKGEPLMERVRDDSIDKQNRDTILKETGKLLSKIHSVKTKKFGWLDENGCGHQDSWTEFILKRTKDTKRYKEVAAKINLDPSLIDRAAEILTQHQDVYSQVEPRLLHGDLGFEHIFVDGSNITGIIDWGNAASGDPIHDFAWWNFFHKDDETGLLLMEGYENKDLFKSEFALKLNLYKLYLSLDFLDYYDQGDYKPGLEITRGNLLRGIGYFDVN